jgi:uncharacterized protein (DUF433 family)
MGAFRRCDRPDTHSVRPPTWPVRICLSKKGGKAVEADADIAKMERAEMQATNFERITVNPNQMGGVPCVRGLRIPVATVLRMLAGGMSEQEILAEYPDLEPEDIRECHRFAAVSAMERELAVPRRALNY